jgi:transcriptional regulator with XRE-family HTH domain
MNIQQKFGIKLKELRLKNGLSQEKLANLAEIDRTYLPGIEKGERNVSLSIIEKLAIALGIEITEFFN